MQHAQLGRNVMTMYVADRRAASPSKRVLARTTALRGGGRFFSDRRET